MKHQAYCAVEICEKCHGIHDFTFNTNAQKYHCVCMTVEAI